MKKLLLIFGVAVLLTACKEGGEELPPDEARGQQFAEMQQRIFDLIETSQFIEGSDGFTFLGDPQQYGTTGLFYLTINGVSTPFNSAKCESVYFSEGEFAYNQLYAAYYKEDEVLYYVAILYDLAIFNFDVNYVVIYYDGKPEVFASFVNNFVQISDLSGSIDNLQLSRPIFDLIREYIGEEYITISGTITCPN